MYIYIIMSENQEVKEAIEMIITNADSVIDCETSKDANYGRCETLYTTAFLDKRMRSIFITIPKSYQEVNALFNSVKKCSKSIKYVLIATEQHTDNTPHYHLQVETTNSISIRVVHKAILKVEGNIGGSINYQSIKNPEGTNIYIKKDGKYLEWGIRNKRKGTKTTYDKEGENKTIKECIEGEGTIEEKLDIIKENQPLLWVDKYDKLKLRLQKEAEPERLYWDLPDMSVENIKLRPYQQRLWDILNKPPKQRQIIWVYGKPNMGKSFMYNYLEENYTRKVYCAGQSASLDNVVYGYDEEGAIIWDIPKSYNWDNEDLVNTLASTIEKFSDYGTTITSKKYQGKKMKVRGHAVVFTNHRPIKQLKHRDIVEIIAGEKEENQRYSIKEKNNTYYVYDKQQGKTASFIDEEQALDYIDNSGYETD